MVPLVISPVGIVRKIAERGVLAGVSACDTGDQRVAVKPQAQAIIITSQLKHNTIVVGGAGFDPEGNRTLAISALGREG